VKTKLQSNDPTGDCEYNLFIEAKNCQLGTVLTFTSTFAKARFPDEHRVLYTTILSQDAINILIDTLLEAKHDYLQTVPKT
jgi:hypothetical protein